MVVGGNCGSWISSVEVLDLESNEWIAGPELPFGIGAGGLVEDYQGVTICYNNVIHRAMM